MKRQTWKILFILGILVALLMGESAILQQVHAEEGSGQQCYCCAACRNGSCCCGGPPPCDCFCEEGLPKCVCGVGVQF